MLLQRFCLWVQCSPHLCLVFRGMDECLLLLGLSLHLAALCRTAARDFSRLLSGIETETYSGDLVLASELSLKPPGLLLRLSLGLKQISLELCSQVQLQTHRFVDFSNVQCLVFPRLKNGWQGLRYLICAGCQDIEVTQHNPPS